MHFHFAPEREVALVGETLDALAEVVRRRYRPTVVLAGMRPGRSRGRRRRSRCLRGRTPVDGRPAAYVCENFTCSLPVTEPEELERQLHASA